MRLFRSKDPAAESVARNDALLQLARKAAERDHRAMGKLVKAVGPAMLRAIRKSLGHTVVDVEDVFQEALEGLLCAIGSFRGECSVLHFACRVGVLTALGWRRQVEFRAQWALDAPEAVDDSASADPSPMDGLHANRRRRTLGVLLGDLPQPQAEVLVLHCALGFTVEELANSIGRPAETVRSRLRLAKQALRDRIEGNRDLAEILEVRR